MKTTAAVLHGPGERYEVTEIDLDPPGPHEVLVEMVSAGLCHSDDHVVTGDLPFDFPMINGHEGAGIVRAVGPGVTSVGEGDPVVFSFVPSCGACPSCVDGHSNLCDLGQYLNVGLQISDQTARHHLDGVALRLQCCLGTFAHHTVVNEASVVALPADAPLHLACLLSCGVITGWGSTLVAGELRAGQTVVVVGAGGIGMNAVQAARFGGAGRIVVVDPLEGKRALARSFGATDTFASMAEAFEPLRDLTRGRQAELVVMCTSLGTGASIGEGLALTAKRGRLVVTNLHSVRESDVQMSMLEVTLMEKRIQGALFGGENPRTAIPRLLDLWRQGRYDLDGLVTRRYALEQIDDATDDLRRGSNIRGVIDLAASGVGR